MLQLQVHTMHARLVQTVRSANLARRAGRSLCGAHVHTERRHHGARGASADLAAVRKLVS